MVATSFWYVTIVPPQHLETAAALPTRHAAALVSDPTVTEGLEHWQTTPDTVTGPDEHRILGSGSQDFLTAFRRSELGEDELVAHSISETEDLTWDLAMTDRPHPCEGLFAAVRGVPVVSLLYQALGPRRASWLPGALGVFAVPPSDLDEAADGVRKAHALSPAERAAAIRRMHSWLDVGEDPGFPVHHLLEGLPEVFATATAKRAGVIGLTGSTDA